MLFPMVASVSDERDAIAVRIPTQITTCRSKLPAPVNEGGNRSLGWSRAGARARVKALSSKRAYQAPPPSEAREVAEQAAAEVAAAEAERQAAARDEAEQEAEREAAHPEPGHRVKHLFCACFYVKCISRTGV